MTPVACPTCGKKRHRGRTKCCRRCGETKPLSQFPTTGRHDRTNCHACRYRPATTTVDFYALWTWIETSLGRRLDQIRSIATLTPVASEPTIYRWHSKGLPLTAAQRVANHFGVHPTDIWPTTWPEGTQL